MRHNNHRAVRNIELEFSLASVAVVGEEELTFHGRFPKLKTNLELKQKVYNGRMTRAVPRL